jgi:hypothetical protein
VVGYSNSDPPLNEATGAAKYFSDYKWYEEFQAEIAPQFHNRIALAWAHESRRIAARSGMSLNNFSMASQWHLGVIIEELN